MTPPEKAPETVQNALTAVQVETVKYGPLPEEVGDLCRPPKAGGNRPAIVIVHGGGWKIGERQVHDGLCRYFASRNMVTFNIDYRLAAPDKPGGRWPAQIVDAQLAVRYLRANATSLGIDPARFGAFGDSVGGTLALMLGTHAETLPGDEAGLYPGVAPDVQAVAAAAGLFEPLRLSRTAWAPNYLALFGTETPAPVVLELISPLRFMDHSPQAVLLLHGDKDTLVPIAQTQMAAASLKVRGVNVTTATYSGGHGFEGTSAKEMLRVGFELGDFFAAALHPPP